MSKSPYLISLTLSNTMGSHIALYAGDPTITPELDKDGYARQPALFTIAGDTATLAADAVFGPAKQTWGTLTHAALFDAATDGNRLWSGELCRVDPTTGELIHPGDLDWEPIHVGIGEEFALRTGQGFKITES